MHFNKIDYLFLKQRDKKKIKNKNKYLKDVLKRLKDGKNNLGNVVPK